MTSALLLYILPVIQYVSLFFPLVLLIVYYACIWFSTSIDHASSYAVSRIHSSIRFNIFICLAGCSFSLAMLVRHNNYKNALLVSCGVLAVCIFLNISYRNRVRFAANESLAGGQYKDLLEKFEEILENKVPNSEQVAVLRDVLSKVRAPEEVVIKYNSEFMGGLVSSFSSSNDIDAVSRAQLLDELLNILVLDETASASVAMYLAGDNGEDAHG